MLNHFIYNTTEDGLEQSFIHKTHFFCCLEFCKFSLKYKCLIIYEQRECTLCRVQDGKNYFLKLLHGITRKH